MDNRRAKNGKAHVNELRKLEKPLPSGLFWLSPKYVKEPSFLGERAFQGKTPKYSSLFKLVIINTAKS